jgi:hypothetical protein
MNFSKISIDVLIPLKGAIRQIGIDDYYTPSAQLSHSTIGHPIIQLALIKVGVKQLCTEMTLHELQALPVATATNFH